MIARLANPFAETSHSYYASGEKLSAKSARPGPTQRKPGSGRDPRPKPYDRVTTSQSRKPIIRKTMNSASNSRNTIKLPATVSIPTPPSRSPSPPTEPMSWNSKSFMYTDSDKRFFIKFIQWELERDISLSKATLCERLAIKVWSHYARVVSSKSNRYCRPPIILLLRGRITGPRSVLLRTGSLRLPTGWI